MLLRNKYLIVNSILLIIASIYISILIVSKANFIKTIAANIKNSHEHSNEKILTRGLRGHALTKGLGLSLVERIEIKFIEKSNIKSFIPFANFYLLAICCIAIFIISFNIIYKTIRFIPSTVVLSSLISAVPLFVLDIMAKYNAEKIRKKIAAFISVLNRWCAVKEDIFYAFEKSIDSGIGEPLKTYIRNMIVQVNRGVEPLEALSMLQIKVDNPQFRDFIINIKQNVKHRGDIRKLLSNLEEQFFRIEEEFNRRKISTYKDRIIIYFIMVMVLVVGYTFLKINTQVEQFYLSTYQGKLLLTVFCLLYGLGFYLTLSISKFDI